MVGTRTCRSASLVGRHLCQNGSESSHRLLTKASLRCERSRHCFQKLSGEYRLSSRYVNGHPMWQREGLGEEAYIYSGRSGKWRLVKACFQARLGPKVCDLQVCGC